MVRRIAQIGPHVGAGLHAERRDRMAGGAPFAEKQRRAGVVAGDGRRGDVLESLELGHRGRLGTARGGEQERDAHERNTATRHEGSGIM